MKTIFTKATSKFSDDSSVGKVHLNGAIDATACGLDYSDYKGKPTSKPVDCTTCLTYLDWAKKVAKKIKQ